MKRQLSNEPDGYVVSGPGTDDKVVPSLGGALSVAQRRAELHAGPVTFYVREGEDVVAHVEREQDDGPVLTRLITEGEHR